MKNDIIIYTLFPTDHPYSSVSLSMAKVLAKDCRVFYINRPYTFKDIIKNRGDKAVQNRRKKSWYLSHYETLDSIPENFITVVPPISQSINWLPKGNIYDYFADYNRRILLKTIQKLIKDYQIKDYIYLNCYNPYGAAVLPQSFQPLLNIYQCIDDISQNPYTRKHGLDLENEAIRTADITLVTSRELLRLKSEISPNVHVLHNAVDMAIFKNTVKEELTRPPELAGINTKIIGFIGNMDELRIDYELLKKVAIKHQDKIVLLVGPLNNTQYKTLGLDQLPNIIFTGSKKLEELPAYLQAMDCALIPFHCNTLTRSIYPLKVNEYLAAGKAVVSTNFSQDIASFSDCIYLADSHESFLHQIEKALQEDKQKMLEKRLQIAVSNTWEARIQQFWEITKPYLNKKIQSQYSSSITF